MEIRVGKCLLSVAGFSSALIWLKAEACSATQQITWYCQEECHKHLPDPSAGGFLSMLICSLVEREKCIALKAYIIATTGGSCHMAPWCCLFQQGSSTPMHLVSLQNHSSAGKVCLTSKGSLEPPACGGGFRDAAPCACPARLPASFAPSGPAFL